jgi:hypothetical protein
MWEEHLMKDGPSPWDVGCTDMTRLRRAMTLMRARMVRWWRKKVSTSFLTWVNLRYTEIEDIDVWSTNQSQKSKTPSFSRGKTKCQGKEYVWSQESRQTYRAWWRRRHSFVGQEIEAGADPVTRAANASWWTWDDGSCPLHWRWPAWYKNTIRDGLKVHFQSSKRTYRKPQRDAPDGATRERMRDQPDKVRKRRYICAAFVCSLTWFVAVPTKGADDIRIVYDGTISGLNEAIWVPRFVLPSLETHLRAVDEDTYMADVDVGDCFLNFMLHPTLRS